MKKGLLLIGITAIAVAVYFIFFTGGAEPLTKAPKQQPLVQGKNSDVFNKPFNEMLDSYFALKNALVEWDSVTAAKQGTTLAGLTAQVPYETLKADTTIIATAKSFSESVSAEALGISGETTLEGMRRSFYTLSENLYNLLRTVQYDQQIIYHDKCPMAFNDQEEGYWLSNTKEIINPYLGKKHPRYASGMIGCGSVEDSLDYRSK
ncbi:MAG TPA: DUF3347 domain-containing protein [Panacibacter sp.]|nr:DUF3347 domain-containing protein [Panacibacter sp.]HNP46100.1 DUF3347 domain-containing protein [Panacibacter sp.]